MSRRVITGLNPEGRSAVIFDGPLTREEGIVRTIWTTDAVPADNSGGCETVREWSVDLMHSGATTFFEVRLPPGQHAPMHATDTIDYLTMLSGSVTLTLETGEVTLHPGDTCVDRGIIHGWRNDSQEDAVYTVVTIPSHPVGAGRTI